MKALSLHQPWASLCLPLAPGEEPVKRIETRSWSTSYRGLLAVHAAKKRPRQAEGVGHFCIDWGLDPSLGGFVNGGFDEGCGFLLVDSTYTEFDADGTSRPLPTKAFSPLPLGVILGTVNLVDVVPIYGPFGDSEGKDCVRVHWKDQQPDVTYLHRQGLTTVITDQLPYGDFTPGRYAWIFEDAKRTDERCPACLGVGSYPRLTRQCCRTCNSKGTCPPIPAKGHQGVWNWEAA